MPVIPGNAPSNAVSAGLSLMNLIQEKIHQTNESTPSSKYLLEYYFSLSQLVEEELEENPELAFDYGSQRIDDNITNLDYALRESADVLKTELFEVALDGFRQLQEEIMALKP